ncbi:hypothetical protein AB9Q04_01585 [Anaerococcus sp. ENR1011]|uniref:Lipoprotein n=1 Tax=Anaerococcus groningensis TaxID=3115616 RepID=A0ABW9MZ03_9FIRM
MNKKLLALALAGTFAFAGCGNNAEKTEEADTTETTVEEPAVEETTTEVEENADDAAKETEENAEDAADDAATEVEEDATENTGN